MAAREVFEGAIGIDLGTTYSCVAAFIKDRVEIIPNDQGNRTTPSFVAFTGKERLVGEPARNQIAKNPVNTVYDAKRLIGRKFTDKEVQNDLQLWPFKVVAGENDNPLIEVEGDGAPERLRPEQVSGLVLAKLKEVAEAYLGKEVKKAVITVPAYFNDAQRTSTKVAGELAGLEVTRIINEPTAAALAYGLDRKTGSDKASLVLVFDLGGGTFDASLIALEGSVYEVKATSGNTHLGGQDFDESLVKYCAQEFKKVTKADLTGNPKALRKLRTAVEGAKRALSSSTNAEVEIDSLHEGYDLHVKITRAKFEQLNAKLFETCLKEVERVLGDAKVRPGDVDEVVMVGGSSRIPKVQEMVSSFFGGKRLNYSINPDEAIAYGAAIQANVLVGSAEAKAHTADVLLLDVAPLSIGLAADNGKFKVLIPRNCTIPRKATEEFTTVDDDQTVVEVEVFEGERPRAAANHFLGKFDLDGIAPAPAGQPSIVVTFSVDADGVLSVTAEDTSPTGKKAEITITNTNKLSSEQINKMVGDAQRFAREDRAFIKLADARAKYEEYLYEIQSLLEAGDVRESLQRAVEVHAEWQESELDSASYDDISEKHDQLVEIHRRILETPEDRRKRKASERSDDDRDPDIDALSAEGSDGEGRAKKAPRGPRGKRTKPDPRPAPEESHTAENAQDASVPAPLENQPPADAPQTEEAVSSNAAPKAVRKPKPKADANEATKGSDVTANGEHADPAGEAVSSKAPVRKPKAPRPKPKADTPDTPDPVDPDHAPHPAPAASPISTSADDEPSDAPKRKVAKTAKAAAKPVPTSPED